MPTKRGLLRGSSVSGKHSTVIPDAELVISVAGELPEVTNVVAGYIKGKGGGKRRLRFTELAAGLRVNVKGSDGAQIIWVYTPDPEPARRAIEQAWKKKWG